MANEFVDWMGQRAPVNMTAMTLKISSSKRKEENKKRKKRRKKPKEEKNVTHILII
jgi:hypothetical protein